MLVVSAQMAIYFWRQRDEVRLATRAVTFLATNFGIQRESSAMLLECVEETLE